ncbi:hypothetical protein B0A49_01800 [Cryomyces minteri]|uniref:PinX1-related protein 1 n=1 Tax=Cryomyces minteri TaxID=331657 RepID=A0A4U0XHK7_9PEZI|nr:hypothetical protein B0A49_01800 [Cryomyces minteri]
MGLSGPKNRTKISRDPNNTNWSRDTEGFGQKILKSQGWTPGQFLGAENAPHASHYSAANASHIRVLLKDDNLGLGASRRKDNAETFGLSVFQGLLGRLNGKSDAELEREQKVQRDRDLALYQGQRWGLKNFVSGGLLVGDKIEKVSMKVAVKESQSISTQKPPNSPDAEGAKTEGVVIAGARMPKKRSAPGDSELDVEAEARTLKRKKGKSDLRSEIDLSDPIHTQKEAEKPRKRKRREADQMQTSAEHASTESAKPPKKNKRKGSDEGLEAVIEGVESAFPGTSTTSTSASTSSDEKADKRRRKLEKRALKGERRLKKEKRREDRADKASRDTTTEPTPAEGTILEISDIANSVSQRPPAPPMPAATVGFAGGRHAVRQRYIQQKRMASMNPQALKEIFMIKT